MGAVMRTLLAASVALVALGTVPSFAADMPAKTAPPREPKFVVYNWTGFYIGIEGGGGWSHAVQTDPRPFTSDAYQPNGGVTGATLGYNAQLDHIVLGLEADGSGSWIKGYTIGTDPLAGNCGGAPPRCFSNLESFATLRARAGITMDNVLPYLTGGLAVGRLNGQDGDTAVNGAFGAGTKTVVGWTVGLGVEAMFNQRWSTKVEYLYVDLGNHIIFNDTVAGAVFPESLRYTSSILRVGLNYRFGY
jgi:outer membrane immunogenic protein